MKVPSADARRFFAASNPAAASSQRALADWNALLHSLQLQVVGGPNDVGAYTVAPATTAGKRDTLQQLRAARGVRLAEPVTDTP